MSLEKYKKLSQREHVLLRKNVYVGSPTSEPCIMWGGYFDNDDIRIEKKEVMYNPALLKIFDEIVSNASDAYNRHKDTVSYIKVEVTETTFSVENDVKVGYGIPIEIHPTENIYIPELIFGHLLTGENYDDSQGRELAGMNGMGVKLANILSKQFDIEVADGKKLYKQTFKDNMSVINEPQITKSTKSYVKAFANIDFSQFEYCENINTDMQSLMLKRCIDLAVYNTNVKIYFNGKLLKVKSFKDWVKLHINNEDDFFVEELNDRWILAVSKSPSDEFNHCSIVSSVSTYRGGTHVNHISINISKTIADALGKKVKITWSDVKNKLSLFLICKVTNPTFDSQCKESLTNTITKDVAGTQIFSDSFIKKIMKSEIVESIVRAIELKEKMELNKLQKSAKKVKIDKLIDATSKDRTQCRIFIFEGDCLHEDTPVVVLKNEHLINTEIKNVEYGDYVITHNNRFRMVDGVSKKIDYKNIIKSSVGNIKCSSKHKWFVYDKIVNEFCFIETSMLDKNKHQLVKNYLAFLKDLLKIKDIIKVEDKKYDMEIILEDKEYMVTSSHKFCCYHTEKEIFEMVCSKDLDKDKHLIVNINI